MAKVGPHVPQGSWTCYAKNPDSGQDACGSWELDFNLMQFGFWNDGDHSEEGCWAQVLVQIMWVCVCGRERNLVCRGGHLSEAARSFTRYQGEGP